MNTAKTVGEQMEERSFHTGGVRGSIPRAPTIQTQTNTGFVAPDEGVNAGSAELAEATRAVDRLMALFSRTQTTGLVRRGRMDQIAIPWLAAAFLCGDVKLRLGSIPTAYWDEAMAFACGRGGRGGEGVFHSAGKRAVKRWLHDETGDEPRYEANVLGGRTDVYSPAKKLLIEVGNTRIDKAMECAASLDRHNFWLVPFRWDEGRPRFIEFQFSDQARADADEGVKEFYRDPRNWRHL